ncbi:MAG: ABC transporter substrate-binding protein [Gammaproteobacteria bacterium]|nr:ABC transporter substrate-binding protein [Gammaproteobacteria bacterium]
MTKSWKQGVLISSLLWVTSLYGYAAEGIVKENSATLGEQEKMLEESKRVVQNALDQILATLKVEKEAIKKDSNKVREIVDQYFVPHFDLPFMTMFIVGQEWRQVKNDTQKKEEVILAIRGWLTRTYTPAISQYENQTVRLLPMSKGDIDIAKKEVIVQSKLLDNGKEYLIKYYLHPVNNTWKVWDINLEGVRLLLNFRSQFKEFVSQYKLEGALKKIQSQSANRVAS